MTAQDFEQLDAFLQDWQENQSRAKKAFVELKSHLIQKPGIHINFIARPGVTYSLRLSHVKHKTRPLFALIDVIEDDPRWLSVCFYGDMVTDPEQKGNLLPGSLLGEDGHCFDVDEYNSELINYIIARMDEALQNAVGA